MTILYHIILHYSDVANASFVYYSSHQVTFAVKELRRIVGSINTMVGNQEGSVITGVKFPNILGRGERLQVNFT